jgi:hypothetical protein
MVVVVLVAVVRRARVGREEEECGERRSLFGVEAKEGVRRG